MVTKSLRDAIIELNNTQLIKDKNLKDWSDKVLNISSGQIVDVPNGLIDTLTLISQRGPIGKL